MEIWSVGRDRPKDLIGQDGKMVRMRIRPKDLIGQDGKMVRMKIRPKDLIGQDGKMVRRKCSGWLDTEDGT